MKNNYVIKFLFLLISCFSLQANSQIVFQEDFDGVGGPTAGGAGTYTFPAGWLLFNVDNRTPNLQVAWVNDAWERREDFKFNVTDSVMFSNSFYNPVGAADDWAWTPPITVPTNGYLTWYAVAYDAAYPDGYEVRIMTTTPTGGNGNIGNQMSSTVLFSTGAENSTWTYREVDLSAYAGQTVYIGFRNPSNDKFIMAIDDVTVLVKLTYDALIAQVSGLSEYTTMAKSQVLPLSFSGTIKNEGQNSLTNVRLNVRVKNSAGVVVHTDQSAPLGSLAPGATSSLISIPSWTPPAVADQYTIAFYPTTNQADQNAANDTIFRTLVVTDKYMTRHTGNILGGMGIGAGTLGYFGSEYQFSNPGRIDSVFVNLYAPKFPSKLAVGIFNTNAAGRPTTLITTTDTINITNGNGGIRKLALKNGPWQFTPGKYVIAAIELDSTLSIGYTSEIFTPKKNWVRWAAYNNGNWAPVDTFGLNFQRAYAIYPGILPLCPANQIDPNSVTITPTGCGISSGEISLSTLTPGNYSFVWDNGATGDHITALAAGNYTVTVTNLDLQCSEVATYSINSATGPVIDNIIVVDANCYGENGTVEVEISGGSPGYTYAWSNGSSDPILEAQAGTYSVTIMDANNCSVSEANITINSPSEIVVGTYASAISCSGCTDGMAAVTGITGGVAPYTISWSNGLSGDTITNLAAGTYQVVVEDASGCSVTIDVVVDPYSTSNEEANILDNSVEIFPNPSNGEFNVKLNLPYNGTVQIELIDITGKVVVNKSVKLIGTLINKPIDMSYHAAGNYMLKITAGNERYVKKVVIK